MKRFQIVTICLSAAFAAFAADTNELERLRAEFVAARKAYMDARKAAGLTTPAPRRAALPRRVSVPVDGLAPTSVLTKEQKSYFKNKRMCIKRDTETIPGSVITYWHRNGKPDTLAPAVVTNVLKHITGREQRNPIQEAVERMRQRAEEWEKRAAELQVMATNATARVDRVIADLDERRAEYVEKRDSVVLPTTKAIYQAFIDAIDRIKKRLDRESN